MTTIEATAKAWHQTECTSCRSRWAGAKTCHCSACHLTFTTITSFDRHRQGGGCMAPAEVGLALIGRDYPCWGMPSGEISPRDRARMHSADPAVAS